MTGMARRNAWRAMWTPLLLAALTACRVPTPSPNTLLHNYRTVPGGNGWHARDTLVLKLPPIAENGVWDMSVGMRTRTDFPYQGIWMVAETRLRHPAAVVRDTFYLRLNDPQGEPLTRGVNLLQREQLVAQQRQFFKGQKGEIRLYHLMHREHLPSITEIGVRLEKSE